MKRTKILYVWNYGTPREWVEPYYVTRGLADELVQRFPEQYRKVVEDAGKL